MKDQTKHRIQTMALWAVSSAALLCANMQAEANVIKKKSSAHPVVTEKYKPVLLHYAGQGNWSLPRLAANVKGFYLKEYGHQPRITAFGQTVTHDRLGFDHKNALDIGVHPDSPEGMALMNYLRANKIPFIGIRSAIPGSATAPHIHVGHESRRVTNLSASR